MRKAYILVGFTLILRSCHCGVLRCESGLHCVTTIRNRFNIKFSNRNNFALIYFCAPVQTYLQFIIRFVIPVVFSKINWICVYICLTQL